MSLLPKYFISQLNGSKGSSFGGKQRDCNRILMGFQPKPELG
jgi:hypothetical protein